VAAKKTVKRRSVKAPKEPEKQYSWNPGAKAFKKLDAQKVGEELERLRIQHGESLDADEVVEAASNPNSPIHEAFPWDDEQAACEYRREVARRLLRAVRVVIITPQQKEVVVRAFISTPKPKEAQKRTYTSISVTMEDPNLRAEVLKQALRELQALRRKYSDLTELSAIFTVIDRTADKIAA
jgi:hypothetical protein